MSDFYQHITNEFVKKADLTEDEVELHLEKVQEEIGEVIEACEEYERAKEQQTSLETTVPEYVKVKEDHLAEEISDGIHSLFVLANMLDIEVGPAFRKKAFANLEAASDERDSDGFVKWSKER